MREIQLLGLSLVFAVLLKMLSPAMTASFLEVEQKKANEDFSIEVEKAKATTLLVERQMRGEDGV